MTPEHDTHRNRGWPSRAGWALVGFLAIAAYFLISEHQAHFIQALPFLLLLACPLLHLFMHGGQGGHGGHGSPSDGNNVESNKRPDGEKK